MPRKSAASLSVVAGTIDGRPSPPADLTKFQTEVWRRVVASEAASFFATAALQGLLKEYCRHVEAADTLAKLIDGTSPATLGSADVMSHYGELLKLRDRETRALADKATKLRLTNQSRYTPQAAGTASRHASTGRKPWEQAG
jgi:hypothetical protein